MDLEHGLGALEIAGTAQNRKVAVDHGETSCKIPDAAAYIRKTQVHRAGKRSR